MSFFSYVYSYDIFLIEMKKKYISIAIQEAEKSPMEHKHGAVVVKNRAIIGKGHNTNYPDVKCGMYSLHAEISAILNCGIHKHILKNSIVCVVRINKQGDLKYSKPCENCTKFIEKYKVRRVYYSVDKNDIHFQ